MPNAQAHWVHWVVSAPEAAAQKGALIAGPKAIATRRDLFRPSACANIESMSVKECQNPIGLQDLKCLKLNSVSYATYFIFAL